MIATFIARLLDTVVPHIHTAHSAFGDGGTNRKYSCSWYDEEKNPKHWRSNGYSSVVILCVRVRVNEKRTKNIRAAGFHTRRLTLSLACVCSVHCSRLQPLGISHFQFCCLLLIIYVPQNAFNEIRVSPPSGHRLSNNVCDNKLIKKGNQSERERGARTWWEAEWIVPLRTLLTLRVFFSLCLEKISTRAQQRMAITAILSYFAAVPVDVVVSQ